MENNEVLLKFDNIEDKYKFMLLMIDTDDTEIDSENDIIIIKSIKNLKTIDENV